jgi:hypothetical protein
VTEKIQGKVAQILNSRELVINRGESHGVEVGMQFVVLNERGADIKDPDTGEVLGSIEVPKVLLKVIRVSGKLAVASTFRKFKTGGGPAFNSLLRSLGSLNDPPREYIETLRTDASTYKEELDPEDSYVHIGDPVVESDGEEFAGWEYGG